jgi:hypothetical protein
MMITGSVVSIEDHGYVISFGIPENVQGFLLNKHSTDYCNQRGIDRLIIGQVDIFRFYSIYKIIDSVILSLE